MPTMTANSSGSTTPAVAPMPATMMPTSPRGTIPRPTTLASRAPIGRARRARRRAYFVTNASTVRPASSAERPDVGERAEIDLRCR